MLTFKEIKQVGQKFNNATAYELSSKEQEHIRLTINRLFKLLTHNKTIKFTANTVSIKEFKELWSKDIAITSTIGADNCSYLHRQSNLKLRIIHDYSHILNNLGVSHKDEFKLGLIPFSTDKFFNAFMRSEVTYQACFHYAYGDYMREQKVVLDNLL